MTDQPVLRDALQPAAIEISKIGKSVAEFANGPGAQALKAFAKARSAPMTGPDPLPESEREVRAYAAESGDVVLRRHLTAVLAEYDRRGRLLTEAVGALRNWNPATMAAIDVVTNWNRLLDEDTDEPGSIEVDLQLGYALAALSRAVDDACGEHSDE